MVRKLVSLVNIVCIMILGITIYLDNNQGFAQGKFEEDIAQTEVETYNHFAASPEERLYAAALNEMGINVSLTGEQMGQDISASRSLTHCKAIVYQTLKSLPQGHVSEVKHLTLRMSDSGNRGLGGGHSIIIRCGNVSDSELVAVMVHEMGHIVDIGLLNGDFFSGKSEFLDGNIPIYNDDLSLGFYRISWKNSSEMRAESGPADFVTGYAMTDPFEDFAESYIMYTLHGTEFRMMARWNDSLQAKYDYIKVNIFDNKEFTSLAGDFSVGSRVYDSTLISYDMKKFLKD